MAPAMKLPQQGLCGLYRFANAESEAEYQARMVQWCFWPTILHLWSTVFITGLSLLGYAGVSTDATPLYAWWLVAVEGTAVFFLAGVHCSKLFQRHVIPILCVFIWLEMVPSVAFIGWRVETWTNDSFACIVPASSSIFVEGPDGRADVGAALRAHLALLAAYRAVQMAIASFLAFWIYNMMLGLNRWTLTTNLALLISLVAGLASAPHLPTAAVCLNCGIAVLTAVLALLFSVSMERMQRRHFEAERLLHWELQASQMADSVLNHSLKNTLADIAGNLEMYLAGALHSKVLEDCIVSLRRGMRSCKERQGYLQLVAGQYQPVLNAIHLQDFGRQLLAGRHATGHFPDCVVYADHMLLTLIFDNALSNATKHGDPQNPDVRFSIEEIPADVCRDLPAGRRRFCFAVTNAAHPGRPELTPERVAQLFAGGAGPPSQPPSPVPVPTLSDGIGLTHCAMAAKLGGIALSLSQEDGLVTFSGTVDVEVQEAVGGQCTGVAAVAAATAAPPAPPPATPALPGGLRYVVLDDSLAAQRLLKFHLDQWCAPAAVGCFGASAGDVPAFLAHALEADVVILDQHLDWDDDPCLGSDLTRQLRRLRYSGFICIRSADDGPSDQALYQQAGANCSVGKDLLGPVMLQQLQAAYHDFVSRREASHEIAPMPPAELLPLTDTTTAVASDVPRSFSAASFPPLEPGGPLSGGSEPQSQPLFASPASGRRSHLSHVSPGSVSSLSLLSP